MRKFTLVFLFAAIASACSRKSENYDMIEFDVSEFLSSERNPKSHEDSLRLFVGSVFEGNSAASRDLAPTIVSLDVSPYLRRSSEGGVYLNNLGEFVRPYLNSSYDMLALAVYLKEKYNSKDNLYDQMLQESIWVDQKNLEAMYLLAKFRYEKGYKSDYLIEEEYERDAFYLVSKIRQLIPQNVEINRVHNSFLKRYQEPNYYDSIESFLEKDAYYLE